MSNKKNSKDKEIVDNKDVAISKDKNNIEDATLKAMQNIDSKVYENNIAKPSTSSKSIRSLDIKNIENVNESCDIIENNISEIIEDNNIENINLNKDYKVVTEKKSTKSIAIILASILIISFLFLIISTVFALFNINNTNIISGVHIKGIDVSGLSKEDAFNKVSNVFSEELSKEIILKHNDYETSVFAEQFGVDYDLNSAIDLAYSKGRSGNIFKNNYNILISIFSPMNILPSFSYDDETFNSLIKEIETNFSDKLIEPSYYVEGNNLIISNGKDGVVINSANFKKEVIYFINNFDCNFEYIDIPVDSKIATKIDINKIYSEVRKDAKDAYYTKDPYVVHPHVDGIDFNISLEEATNLLSENKESYSIPLKVVSPNINTSQIGTEAFPNLLATYYTTYSTKNSNRSTNIRLASNKINGTVIMPGEIFSYNQVVGKRTAAAGFKSAAVYSGGEVTTGIGGGICQVSSTLYNAVLLSNLEIVERTNHGFDTGYVPAGRDATVSWGGPDFKFKNNRDYPIKIICSGNSGKINFQIFGLKSNNEYEVVIESSITSWIPFKTITKQDSSLPKGTTKVIQSGSKGCRSVAYRVLKQNGQIISRTLLSKDTYNPHNKIVAVGTR